MFQIHNYLSTYLNLYDKSVISILLSEFVVTVKKRDDGDFKSDSLYNGICAINRQFKEFFKHQAPFNILQDFEFSTFRDILHAQMIELEEMNNGKSKSADPLSEEEMSHIFNHPALSCDIPEGLFRRIFLWIGCCSARRGGTYQEIMYDHFKKHDDGGFDLVIIHDKTHQGGLYHRSHSGYKQPLSHIIPPDEKGTIGAYLNAGKWFTRKHAGHDKLSRMLQEICTITGIDCVNRNIINHSIRKTIAQKLNDNGLDPQAIMNITLHRSITELNCYRSQNENQRITVNAEGLQCLARKYLKPGKNEGWWTTGGLLDQVLNYAIPIFEVVHPNAVAVFAFDNSTNHESMAKDVLNVNNMDVHPGDHPDYPNQEKGMKEILD
ncbi:12031_t:CDS:2 [Entrophospora sp. SA101]|nr:12031_t:CDS:2 [Entrophospora sp. SA101]